MGGSFFWDPRKARGPGTSLKLPPRRQTSPYERSATQTRLDTKTTRFPLKGSFKGDIDIATDINVDIDVYRYRYTIHSGSACSRVCACLQDNYKRGVTKRGALQKLIIPGI